MNFVCPSFQCPPTKPSAPPRSLTSITASVHCPYFTKNRFFVRLRSSQIVSDRLRSSRIVRAHRRPPSAIPADLPKCSPDSARQTGKKARHFTSFRDKMSPQTPMRKEAFSRHLEVIDISRNWSTNRGIYSMPAFSSVFGSPDSWPEDRRASPSRQPCPTQESNEPSFRQMSTGTGTKNSKHKTQNHQYIPLSKEKNTATFGDIWGHLGTYVPLSRRNDRTSVSLGKGPGRQPFQICAHAVHGDQQPDKLI